VNLKLCPEPADYRPADDDHQAEPPVLVAGPWSMKAGSPTALQPPRRALAAEGLFEELPDRLAGVDGALDDRAAEAGERQVVRTRFGRSGVIDSTAPSAAALHWQRPALGGMRDVWWLRVTEALSRIHENRSSIDSAVSIG